jgi:hypothetical protein
MSQPMGRDDICHGAQSPIEAIIPNDTNLASYLVSPDCGAVEVGLKSVIVERRYSPADHKREADTLRSCRRTKSARQRPPP